MTFSQPHCHQESGSPTRRSREEAQGALAGLAPASIPLARTRLLPEGKAPGPQRGEMSSFVDELTKWPSSRSGHGTRSHAAEVPGGLPARPFLRPIDWNAAARLFPNASRIHEAEKKKERQHQRHGCAPTCRHRAASKQESQTSKTSGET